MIIFTGVAGAGKSVQGKLLAEELGYQWVSVGEILRAKLSDDRREDMLAGKLLADQEIIDIISEFMDTKIKKDRCILDGFPRTLTQAKWLLARHKTGVSTIRAVVHLAASKEVVKERLLKRGRLDDTHEAINVRFEEYESHTLPIVSWFQGENIPVIEVDGEGSIEAIHQAISTAVEAL